MKFYWSLTDVQELEGLSLKKKRHVHRLCVRRHFLFAPITRRSAFAYTTAILCVVVCVALCSYVAKGLNLKSPIWYTIGGAALGAWVGSFLFSHLAIPVVRGYYRETIAKDFVPLQSE